MRKKVEVGLLLISTGKYHQFINPLLETINKHFFKDDNLSVFLFTDDIKQSINWPERVNYKLVNHVEHEPWPSSTLNRYEYFSSVRNQIYTYAPDYVFYVDVDSLFVKDFSIHLKRGILIAIHHCGFANGGWGSVNTPENSTAFLSPEEYQGNPYYMGGFQGGCTKTYLQACLTIRDNIREDKQNNVMAEWHDESHWNAYLLKNKELYSSFMRIGPTFYMAEEMPDAQEKATILALQKNHLEIRS